MKTLEERVLELAEEIKPPFAMCYNAKNYFALELSYKLRELVIPPTGNGIGWGKENDPRPSAAAALGVQIKEK